MKQQKVILSLVVFLFGILLTACGNRTNPGLHEIGNDEFYEIVTSNSEAGYWVYIARPTCLYCQEMESVLEETLQYLDVPMYYFQTDRGRYEDEDRMLGLLAPLGIDGIPIIVHLVDGYVASYLIGVHTQAEIIEFIEANGSTN